MTAIVILALIAAFVGMRLYSVLGERTGHEQQPILRPAEAESRVDAPMPTATRESTSITDHGDLAYVPLAGPGVRALLAADPSFDVARFLEGAGAAYRQILESFWRGDMEAVRPYVDSNVFDAFSSAVTQRSDAGLTIENRLVTIEQPVIVEAEVDKGVAELTVRFEADIAAVTRNASGEVVAGSMSDAIQTRDRWTFRRDVRSSDPNWLLIETDEEE
ncbi:MAG: Tim44/TimA family putative adaptor protein [Sphingomicrobium sp.]